MALTGTDRGTGTHNTGATSFGLAPASNLTAGAMAVLCVAADNAASGGAAYGTFSVTDTKGNTWTRRQTALIDPGAANAGHVGAIFTTPQNGGALTTGDTITVSFGSDAPVAKTWTLMEVAAGAAGASVAYVTGNVGTSGTGGTSPTITTTSIPVGDMTIAALFLEAGTTETITQDGDTTNGSWSTQQTNEIGATTSGSNVASQRKVQTTTASTQTYNPTLGIAGDLCLAWIQLHELLGVAPALLSQTASATAPTVTSSATVAPTLLDRTAVATAPTVTVVGGTFTVTPALLDQTATATAPTVTATASVVPALIDRTATASAPTVAPGAVTLSPALIDRTATATPPTVAPGAVTVAPALLDRTAQATAPGISSSAAIAPALINQAAATVAPTISSSAAIVLGLLSTPATATAPTVSTLAFVSIGLLNQSAQALGPAVAVDGGPQAVVPALLDGTAVALQPAVSSSATIAAARIDQVAEATAPTLSSVATLAVALLDATAAAFAPTVGDAVVAASGPGPRGSAAGDGGARGVAVRGRGPSGTAFPS